MAHGRKTGGRNFTKGQGGRKKGAKDRVPRGLKAKITHSIKALYEAMLKHEPEIFEQSIRRGLKSSGNVSFNQLQLAAYYIDGKPTETVKVQHDLSKLTLQQKKELERLLAVAQS